LPETVGAWQSLGTLFKSAHLSFAFCRFLLLVECMKKLTLVALLTAAVAISTDAADKKEKDLPPGLQKKDKLPPGIAKKRGSGDEVRTVTNTVFVTNTVPATPNAVPVVPTPNVAKVPGAPAVAPMKVDLDKRAKAINTLDNKEAPRRAGLAAISRETGVSVAKLQAQRREHENIGTAGLTMANLIAAKTGKPAGNYIQQHATGKSWERIAADNDVKLDELDAKVARVEEAMRNAK
jgi:hypothetical protein